MKRTAKAVNGMEQFMKCIPAEDYCSSVRDGTHDTPKPVDSGYKLITGKHIKNGIIDESDAYYISEEDYDSINKRSLVEQWDVVMSMIGTVGEAAVVKNNPQYAIKNIALFKCGGSEIKGRWLAYYLNSVQAKGSMQGAMKGASQQFLSLKQLRALPIPLAPEKDMKRAVDILSTYDDLIENNRKQIKLLEEAAQRLYKEWFIDLRFPGHEDTPIVDGVPKGWAISTISDFGDIVTGKTPSTGNRQYYGGPIPFVKIPDMHDNVYPIRTEVTLSKTGADTQRNKFIPRNSIMVSCIATVGLVSISAERCQTNQQINTIIPYDEKDLYYLYSSMKRLKEILEGVGSNGATMTNVNKTKFAKLPVLCPVDELRVAYYNICKPLFMKIYNHSLCIGKLMKARDGLLPKLMSGEIAV